MWYVKVIRTKEYAPCNHNAQWVSHKCCCIKNAVNLLAPEDEGPRGWIHRFLVINMTSWPRSRRACCRHTAPIGSRQRRKCWKPGSAANNAALLPRTRSAKHRHTHTPTQPDTQPDTRAFRGQHGGDTECGDTGWRERGIPRPQGKSGRIYW